MSEASKEITLKIDGKDVDYIRKDSVPEVIAYKPSAETGPWEIGKPYFIRTVTMALHGTLVDVTAQELVLYNAAWIADTGRFSSFVNRKTEPGEVEPFPRGANVIVGRGALIDAVRHDGKYEDQK